MLQRETTAAKLVNEPVPAIINTQQHQFTLTSSGYLNLLDNLPDPEEWTDDIEFIQQQYLVYYPDNLTAEGLKRGLRYLEALYCLAQDVLAGKGACNG